MKIKKDVIHESKISKATRNHRSNLTFNLPLLNHRLLINQKNYSENIQSPK